MDSFTGALLGRLFIRPFLSDNTFSVYPPTTPTAHLAVCLWVASPEVTSTYFLYMLCFFFLLRTLPKEPGVGHEPMLLWFFRSLLRLDALSMLDMNMKGTFAPSIEAFVTL